MGILTLQPKTATKPDPDLNSLSSLAAMLEMIFETPDEELVASGLDETLLSLLNDQNIEEAVRKQIEDYQAKGLSFEEVEKASKITAEGIEDLIKELMEFGPGEIGDHKKVALSKFFEIVGKINEKIVSDYPREDAEIFIELISNTAKIPQYQNLLDCGADVYSPEDFTIQPGETFKLPLGFKLSIPPQWELTVRPRSGYSLKTKMRIANTPGSIDPNFLDEVCLIIDNIGDSPITIKAGDRPAQLKLDRRYVARFTAVKDIANYASGNRGGGFGHTGQ